MARQFMALGFTKVYVLQGGWQEWKRAGFPTERAD
ncbi:MAG: hypothetical protein HY730_10415 [Candidatus Tectomicrobia bacterium]|uniref:Rhodanese domain-containing protein n=1 Tax=Tectimicrobiota bacterium TaxID=2528274 RepID=A0A933GMQ9_UNCTE|nr:hypothetical protein [Candidatus Tectomicrobia bacterium]